MTTVPATRSLGGNVLPGGGSAPLSQIEQNSHSANNSVAGLDLTPMDPKALDSLRKYVDDEYTSEWQRKSSFETRAFAMITANIAVVTILLALVDKDGSLTALQTGVPSTLVFWGLILNGASVLSALLSALPLFYPSVANHGLEMLFRKIREKPDEYNEKAVTAEVIDVRLGQLASAKFANDLKAIFSTIAFVAVVLASSLHSVGAFSVL